MQAPPLAQQAPAACYVCQLANTPGKFLPEQAAALGVPKGPLFGRLKAGQPVQAADGRTVQPTEVRPHAGLCHDHLWAGNQPSVAGCVAPHGCTPGTLQVF